MKDIADIMIVRVLFVVILHIYLTLCQRVPNNPCPNVFQYQRDNNGLVYGRVVVQNDFRGRYNLQVNVSYATMLNQNIQIHLQTKANDIVNGAALAYNVVLPIQDLLPKITQILFNGRIICSGPPEPLLPGRSVSSMWAQHELRTSITQVPQGQPQGPPKGPNYAIPDYYEPSNFVTPTFPIDNQNNNNNFEDVFNKYPVPVNTFPGPDFTTKTTPFVITRLETTPFTTSTITTTTTTTRPRTRSTTTTEATINTQLFTSPPRDVPPNRISPTDFSECGISGSQPLVIGGTEVRPGEFPWLVAIIMLKSKTNYEYICTGNLITNKHVLTAAHCVVNQPKENIFCILGTHNISNWLVNDHVLRGLRLVNVHFEYRPQNISSDADVAILTMQKEVEFQRNIRPICLWHNNKGTADNLIDRMGLVAGWGKSSADNDFNEIPRSITMPIVRTSDCYGSSFNFFSILSNRTFCAGKRDNNGPCTGDSGAGFLLKVNSKWTLRGLVSRALSNEEKSCNLQHYIVFADVAKVISWIDFILTI